MTIALAGIIQGTDCLLVCVQVVLSISGIIAKSLGYRAHKEDIDEYHGSQRQVPQMANEGGSCQEDETRDRYRRERKQTDTRNLGAKGPHAIQIYDGPRDIQFSGESRQAWSGNLEGSAISLVSHNGRLNHGPKGLACYRGCEIPKRTCEVGMRRSRHPHSSFRDRLSS